MTRAAYAWPVSILIGAWIATLVALANASTTIRAPVVIAFVLGGPGLALVRLVPVQDVVAVASLAIATSIALATLVPLMLLYAGLWSPLAALVILAGIATVAAIVDSLRIAEERRDCTP